MKMVSHTLEEKNKQTKRLIDLSWNPKVTVQIKNGAVYYTV